MQEQILKHMEELGGLAKDLWGLYRKGQDCHKQFPGK